MYKIIYDDLGNILQYTTVLSHEEPGLNSAKVPEQYNDLIKKVSDGNRSIKDIKVDMESKNLVLIDIATPVKTKDRLQNKFVKVSRNTMNNDLSIVIKTIDSKPCMLVTSNHEDDRKFSLYLTRKGNINYLYQSFECETNKTNTFEIDQLDYRKLFSEDFSLYYRKIFKRAGYQVQ
jgi:hypothetical protein